MRLSIRNQIVLLVSAFLLMALGSILAVAIYRFNADVLAAQQDLDSYLARTLAGRAQADLQDTVDELLAYDSLLADQAAPVLRDPDILGIEIWQRSGTTFSLAHHREVEEHLESVSANREILDRARQTAAMDPGALETEGLVLRNASVPGLPLVRLWTRGGDGTRVLVADIRPERLLPSTGLVPPRLGIYLVDARGTVLAHPDRELVVARADRSRTDLVRRALEETAPGAAGKPEARGDEAGAYAVVPGTRASVIVELAKEQVSSSAWNMARSSAVAALAVLGLALLASFLLAQHLVGSLHKLQEKMESVSRGDFAAEVEVPTGKELGALAEAFNRMSRELGARELALLDANQQLIQSEKLSAVGEMAAGLAHEVKNPMVGICGFSELGGHVETLEEAHEFFALINADAQRANDILQHLLAFARPEKMAQVELDVNDMVRGAVRLITHQVQINGVRLATTYTEQLPKVLGSANHLRQVLINLSMNATYAMDRCPEKVLTFATGLAKDGRVRITVSDTGKGMTAEVQQKLFRPFFTTKPTGQGTGLGLSVSKAIILQHKGEISVKSAPDQGATFTILLPALGRAPEDTNDDEITGL